MQPYPKVLVVLRRLGWYPGAEVYAEEGVLVRLLELPEIPDVADLAPLTEKYVESQLPWSWRRVMAVRARQIHSEVYRGVSLEDAAGYAALEVALKRLVINTHDEVLR